MAQSRLEIAASFDSSELHSAPSTGADFLSRPRLKKNARPAIVRLRHQKPAPTLDNGMVDMDGLVTYMHPNSLSVPLYPRKGWKYHHVNHTKTSFRQAHLPLEDRDEGLVFYRNSPYQQLHLRVSSEATYHNLHEQNISHPASEVVEAALRDFERLDMLGAACLTLNILNGQSKYRANADERLLESMNSKEMISFMEEVREDCARAVVKAEIIPDKLVTSALKRLALHLEDPYMSAVAARRLRSDPFFYPVKVPSARTLMIKANKLIGLNSQVKDLPTIRDEIELAARAA